MAQPGPDHIEVNIGLEQVHCRGMANGMGCDPSGEQRGTRVRSHRDTMGNNVAHAKPGEPVAFPVTQEADELTKTKLKP